MCSFATRTDSDFSAAMRGFVIAQAGLIQARPGRIHHNLNPLPVSHEAATRAAPESFPVGRPQLRSGDTRDEEVRR